MFKGVHIKLKKKQHKCIRQALFVDFPRLERFFVERKERTRCFSLPEDIATSNLKDFGCK
jgi:hypothetical protein